MAPRIAPTLYSSLEALLARHSRSRRADVDRSAISELELRCGARALPPGMTIEWLGTAGFRLTHEGTTVLIDPFLSRRSLTTTLASSSIHSDRATLDRLVPEADAVLVGHCHFDHAVDVPEYARRGATVYGSSSVTDLLGLHGLADRSVEVHPNETYEIGPFTVRFVPSRHSRLLLGLAVPSDGEFTCDSLDSLKSSAYRCGQVWGIHIEVDGRTIYHLGSADLVEEDYRLGPVDVLLCCIAGRSMTRKFTPRVLSTFDPGLIVPHHFDDFFQPLVDPTASPQALSLNIDVSGFIDDVAATAPGLEVATLATLQTYRG